MNANQIDASHAAQTKKLEDVRGAIFGGEGSSCDLSPEKMAEIINAKIEAAKDKVLGPENERGEFTRQIIVTRGEKEYFYRMADANSKNVDRKSYYYAEGVDGEKRKGVGPDDAILHLLVGRDSRCTNLPGVEEERAALFAQKEVLVAAYEKRMNEAAARKNNPAAPEQVGREAGGSVGGKSGNSWFGRIGSGIKRLAGGSKNN
ncbi:MAG: hypothetical protein MUD10_00790 [Candidatus Pacebacteria bacterium]|nr:hypothetical protein [Candidatus Paceibacterota bacterium]